MDKDYIYIYIYTHTHTHIYTHTHIMEYYSVIRKKIAICSNMDRTGGLYIVWYRLYVESKNYNKLVNITKKKQNHRYRE